MKNGHLTDEMIQEFIWSSENPDLSARAHMLTCEHCKTRAENYQLLFTEIEQLSKPAFNFDLSKLVLNQVMEQNPVASLNADPLLATIPAIEKLNGPRRKNIWPGIIITLMTIGLIGTPVYLFLDSIQDIISEVSTMVTYLIIMTVVLIAAFLVFDEYRKYNHQINSLDI
ncbi:hypothetical protein [Flavitalea sp.]|nr:hypothetical protein [Flavitalea sp.]